MNKNYLELLNEYGIQTDSCSQFQRNCEENEEVPKIQKVTELQSFTRYPTQYDNYPFKCCYYQSIVTDKYNECYYCNECGLCMKEKVIVYQQPTYSNNISSFYFQKPLGSTNTITFYRKRFYKPLTHFKEHLRRYMGSRFTNIPHDLISKLKDVDVENVNAYFLIKAKMKSLGLNKYYKEIFMIIYQLGGVRPYIDNVLYEQCVADFQKLMFHFIKGRNEWKRHSMPSMYMVLDILLRKNGHTPYYTIPCLKDDQLRERVYKIYNELADKSFFSDDW